MEITSFIKCFSGTRQVNFLTIFEGFAQCFILK